MSTSEDSARTKEYITEALFRLMKLKPYDKISIKELTEKAGVGRVTFYRHFDSKDDIIIQYFSSEIPKVEVLLPREPKRKEDFYEIIFVVFSRLKEQKSLFRLLQESKLEYIYMQFLNNSLTESYKKISLQDIDDVTARYSAYYAAGCLFNVSMEWIRNDCKESVKFLTDLYFEHVFAQLS